MFLQIALAFLGFIAIYLTQQKNERLQKYACIFGLLSQPLFLYSTFHAEQWGMFALSIAYTYAWLVGFRNNWFKKPLA